jgi:hypothetical protein
MEMRVARLWFWEGHYARLGVDLKRHYHPEPLLVTDLDLLAFEFSPMLRRTKTIGEVKTGTGKNAPKPLDRIIWLRGLMELVKADHAEFTSSNGPSPRAKDLARSLGVRAQSQADVERRERLTDISAVSAIGSHGTRAFLEQRWVHQHCGKDKDLERAYWFLRSDVWFHDELTAAKRLLGLYRQLSNLWVPQVDDDDNRALRWLLAETVSVFTVSAVAVAADALLDDSDLLAARVGESLSAGLASADVMRKISADVDKYVAGVLSAANAPASLRMEVMGAMHPTAPEWTEQFVDLLKRLALSRAAARHLPRQLDALAYERIVWRRNLKPETVQRLELDDPAAGRLVRLVAAFLRSQAGHVDVVDRALTAPIPLAGQGPGEEQLEQPGLALEMPDLQPTLLDTDIPPDSQQVDRR